MALSTETFKNILTLTWCIGALLITSVKAQDYIMDPDWPKPLPDGIEWGQVPNVTIDAEGYIYAFHRSDPQVLKFDSEVNLVDSFGGHQIWYCVNNMNKFLNKKILNI